ncbi:trypsin-like peptidase domain-containing protein [Enterococcus casseliflavus]|uniref:trypsin-like serine peptidase n=1 Tax=Enterococcus casseliflavus TaxID=37734 RepID=UPI001E557609|nr:trypsin-like peptidase domain-containing protein [Enterococcus casseliflavus]MCD5161414.1 trypsin-like peptidase domain-containing protein [Enterococcus casseliflavus]MCD5192434.1 trypsin-like peptidase domain-containing protein [Enterococcus casseliflavus]
MKSKLKNLYISFLLIMIVFSIFSLGLLSVDAGSITKRSILDPNNDRRTRVTMEDKNFNPNIGRLLIYNYKNNGFMLGTAFSIGDNCIVTNKHVAQELFDDNKIENIGYFFSGIDGDTIPHKPFVVKNCILSEDADIAVVSLYPNEENDTLDSVSTGLNLKPFSKEDSYLSITGYPNSKSNQQWTHSNSIDYSQNDNEEYHKLFYDIDTSVGQSGSPIINSHGDVIGVHSDGDIGNNLNSGIKFSDKIISWISITKHSIK